jgi:hypothetical protein
MTPAAFGNLIAEEIERWAKVVKLAGVTTYVIYLG